MMKSGRVKKCRSVFSAWVCDESGATAIEYGLMAGLLAIALIGGATTLGAAINAKFNAGATALNTSIP